jgi:hypothetical protein
MHLPGYDAWKLATPPEYETSAEEERAMEEAKQQRLDEFRGNLEDCIHDERGSDLTFNEVLDVLIAITQDLKRW